MLEIAGIVDQRGSRRHFLHANGFAATPVRAHQRVADSLDKC